jgi:hypothetical protein
MAKGIKTGGRQKGTPNKATAAIKDSVLQALDEVGGVDYLKRVANENQAAFCTLLGKILPTQLTGPNDGAIQVEAIKRIIVNTGNPDT